MIFIKHENNYKCILPLYYTKVSLVQFISSECYTNERYIVSDGNNNSIQQMKSSISLDCVQICKISCSKTFVTDCDVCVTFTFCCAFHHICSSLCVSLSRPLTDSFSNVASLHDWENQCQCFKFVVGVSRHRVTKEWKIQQYVIMLKHLTIQISVQSPEKVRDWQRNGDL